MKIKAFLVLIAIFSIPTFIRLVRPGVHTTQDFHFFRLVEFDKCLRDLQIPCRWSPDAGYGYGEPLFNFYGQAPYVFAEAFHLLGISKIDSLKIVFGISLIGSALAMFIFAKRLWKSNLAAFISAMVYLYAPYRAVDVWVRGALPETLAFVLFPLILYFLDKYIDGQKVRDALVFSLLLALLVVTHNLSAVMFLPIIIAWVAYKIVRLKKIKVLLSIFLAGLLSLLLASFYLLPVIFESPLVTLEATTKGYFDFRGHFVGLSQLLNSRYWGYGASVFGSQDGLNLSVGHVQWIAPLIVAGLIFWKRKFKKYLPAIVLVFLGWLALFITHSKSIFIWEALDFMKFIQFPWRFLGIAVFCFSLAAGLIAKLFGKTGKVVGIIFVLAAILLNAGFFREDIWLGVSDKELTSGQAWIDQTASSIKDFWPKYGGEIPKEYAPDAFEGTELAREGSDFAIYRVNQDTDDISFPINYFPGWTAYEDGGKLEVSPNDNGLITIPKAKGLNIVFLKFENTNVRTLGNLLSFAGVLVFLTLYYRRYLLE